MPTGVGNFHVVPIYLLLSVLLEFGRIKGVTVESIPSLFSKTVWVAISNVNLRSSSNLFLLITCVSKKVKAMEMSLINAIWEEVEYVTHGPRGQQSHRGSQFGIQRAYE